MFFHIYPYEQRFNLDVFRWDEETKAPVYEVLGGQPLAENIDTNPTGIVTFAHPDAGTFLYKFRTKPGISQIFGRVPIDKDIEVRITDRAIEVREAIDGVIDYEIPPKCKFERNQFLGLRIGIQVHADGSITMGSNDLPEGMILERGER